VRGIAPSATPVPLPLLALVAGTLDTSPFWDGGVAPDATESSALSSSYECQECVEH
jgi:hypothetical protein